MSDLMRRPLAEADPEIAAAIDHEIRRQHEGLEMIASENFVSQAVLEAVGSVFTNKYAEGYPGKRYYGGCEFADVVENLARDRAKQLFGADHANVQPHSGSQANAAAYMAVINPGDTILGLDLAHGGPPDPRAQAELLRQALPRGLLWRGAGDGADRLRQASKPLLSAKSQSSSSGEAAHTPGSSILPACARSPTRSEPCSSIDMAHFAGLVAGGVHPSPVPHAHLVTTTTHKTLRGPRSGMILCQQQYAAAVDRAVFPGQQGGPLVHVIAGKAVAFREALEPGFKQYAQQVVVNAQALAETLIGEGYRVISGGTDTHLMLVDVFSRGILGSEAEFALHEAGITVNKNAIPYDANPPLKPSGIRIGSPALTTRGMREPEMRTIGKWITQALDQRNDPQALRRIRGQVLELVEHFPLYGWLRVPETVAAEYGP